MKNVIKTSITINASAQRVWDILVDLESYSQWNPFILRAQGTIALGQRLVCEPKLPGGRQYTFTPTITRCVPGTEFACTGDVIHSAIAAGEHIFRIREIAANKVELIHEEVFTGLLAPLVMYFAKDQTTRGFILMNEALKKKAEAS